MSSGLSLGNKSYNPDVLSCLANLSNDEVFTSPQLANKMLDLLPEEIWHDSSVTFLDPFTKTGVFLREITKRLIKGLEDEIPDLQERVNHILNKQVWGIAITELTALLSRRTLYCSKKANSELSIDDMFDDPDGHIRYRSMEHTWDGVKCVYCGANKAQYDRADGLESYTYEFIHTFYPERIFNMQFDVIIGNPPYQIEDGGAQKSASPIYQKFVEQAIKMNPRYISMIIPARWYNGGKGLDQFRERILHDDRMSVIHDFPETSDCFPGLNIRGGVCYFLWDSMHTGDCHIVNHSGTSIISDSNRPLLEKGNDTFIRFNQAIQILNKVRAFNEPSFSNLVSARKPFGLPTNFSGFSNMKTNNENVVLYKFRDNGFVSEGQISKNKDWVDQYKVLVPYASPGQDEYPHLILSEPIVAGPGSACTETYLVIGPFDDKDEADNVASYMRTQFFRFMLFLLKSTQHITQKVYRFVPMQDFSHPWTDSQLYSKYNITDEEISFISSLIKPLASTIE